MLKYFGGVPTLVIVVSESASIVTHFLVRDGRSLSDERELKDLGDLKGRGKRDGMTLYLRLWETESGRRASYLRWRQEICGREMRPRGLTGMQAE